MRVAQAKARDDRIFLEDADRLAAGIYFLKWRSLSGATETARLVINR